MKYKDLSHLIGEDVTIKGGADPRGGAEPKTTPKRIIVLAEYPKTILVEKVYRYGSYRRMISKAALYCGDVKMFHNGTQLKGVEA